jgi:hypothetical protein
MAKLSELSDKDLEKQILKVADQVQKDPSKATLLEKLVKEKEKRASRAENVGLQVAMKEGEKALSFASQLAKGSTDRIKKTFAASFTAALMQAIASLGTIVRNPIKLSFITLTFFLICSLAMGLLVTAFLVPVFVIGYISIMDQFLREKKISLQLFIGFMRHGLDSIWHLFMLLASFIVTLATLVAPVVMVLAIIIMVWGGIQVTFFPQTYEDESGVVEQWDRIEESRQAARFLNGVKEEYFANSDTHQKVFDGWLALIGAEFDDVSKAEAEKKKAENLKALEENVEEGLEDALAEEERQAELARLRREEIKELFKTAQAAYEAWKDEDFQDWKLEYDGEYDGTGVITSFGDLIGHFLESIKYLLIVLFLLIPVFCAIELMFTMGLLISKSDDEKFQSYDLVYNAFGDVFKIAAKKWKEVLMSSLILSLIGAVCSAVVILLQGTFMIMGFMGLHNFTIFILAPVVLFAYLIYSVVFIAMTSIRLGENSEEITVYPPAP